MIFLTPILSNKIWGYEQWIASTHKDGKQQDFADAIQGDYPLLVKVIHANEKLSIQVHPDDKDALRLENEQRGKTECWYILDATRDASLVYGLNKNYTKEELEKAINDKSLENCLNIVKVKTGDFIYIPAGTVHAICGGLHLLEVQQSSNTTYRLYDWGRDRPLHIQKGLEVIKNDKLNIIKKFPQEFNCKYFSLKEIDVIEKYDFLTPSGNESFNWQLVFIISGFGQIESTEKKQAFSFTNENIFAIAPEEKITIKGNAKIMHIICKKEA